jgi:hypothetical protein
LREDEVDSVTSNSAAAIFVTSHFDVHGTVSTGSSRILDVLNDHNTRFLKLDKASIFPHGQSTPISELHSTVLVKANIHLVLLLGEDRPSESKVFFASLSRKTVNVVLTMPTTIVEGRIHVKAASDPQGYWSLEAGTFFPITTGTIRDANGTAEPRSMSVILVNKDVASSFAFAKD